MNSPWLPPTYNKNGWNDWEEGHEKWKKMSTKPYLSVLLDHVTEISKGGPIKTNIMCTTTHEHSFCYYFRQWNTLCRNGLFVSKPWHGMFIYCLLHMRLSDFMNTTPMSRCFGNGYFWRKVSMRTGDILSRDMLRKPS